MQNSDYNKDYFTYLSKRSTIGSLYRNFFLYPKLAKMLKGKVLDYGCGIGDFLKFHSNSIGVDINQYNINYCNKLGLQALLIKPDELPFETSSIDSVIMDNVLEHILKDDVNKILNELLRVLKPGGLILIGVPGIKGYASDNDHKCFYSESDLVELLSSYNCRKSKVIHTPIRALWLQGLISQYCIYALFEKS